MKTIRITRLAFFVALSLLCIRSHAQNLQLRQYSVAGGFHHGFIIPHRSTVEEVIDGHVNGLEFNIIRQTNGSKEWHHAFGLPETGLSISCWDFGNKKELGRGFAAVPYIDFPMAGNKNFTLDLRFGWGISYIDKKFDIEDNYKNLTIGTNFNYTIMIYPHFRYRFSERLNAGAGFGLTHFSNGALTMPNLGINVISATAAIHYSFGKTLETSLQKDTSTFRTRPYWSFYAGGGIKETYPVAGPKYYAITLFADRSFQVTRKSAFGAGTDIFYDQSDLHALEEEENKELSPSQALKIGIHGSYELCISRLSFTFNMGTYLHANVTTYGRIYHRIGTRYMFSDNMFACLNLKTHFGKADYVEYGIGYIIKDKKRWKS